MLYVRGDVEHARRVLREQGRGYWAAAFTAALEKHGYLACREVGPEELLDDELWDAHGCAFVAGLPPASWREELLAPLLDAHRPALLEGPLPPALRDALGIVDAEPVDREGLVRIVDASLAEAVVRRGGPNSTTLRCPTSRPVDLDPATAWARLPAVPIDEAQATAWMKPGWDAERWTLADEVEVLAEWLPADGSPPAPAVIRRGSIVACAVQLLAAVGQMHTSAPWEPGTHWNSPRVLGIEQLLLALADDLHRAAGVPRAALLPWPRGGRWVLNVRHDFDRPMSVAEVARTLDGHDRVGTAATWYWRARHVGLGVRRLRHQPVTGDEAVRLVAARARHEVALHTEALWNGAEGERKRVERAVGAPVVGTSAHGDPACFRFQGAPNVLWSEDQRMLYTELVQHGHLHPHRFAAMERDGGIRILKVICLPHHESFDRSMQPGDVARERIDTVAPTYIATGGMLQVMNHPDLNRDALFELLGALPAAGRVDWTAREAASWWRASHVMTELAVEPLRGGRIALRSSAGLRDALLEVLHPSGERRFQLLDLAAGERVTVDAR